MMTNEDKRTAHLANDVMIDGQTSIKWLRDSIAAVESDLRLYKWTSTEGCPIEVSIVSNRTKFLEVSICIDPNDLSVWVILARSLSYRKIEAIDVDVLCIMLELARDFMAHWLTGVKELQSAEPIDEVS